MDWNERILEIEVYVRAGTFIGVLAIMAGWEMTAPRRALSIDRFTRWRSNLALVVLSTILIKLLIPIAATGAALLTAERGWGLLPMLNLPFPLTVCLSIILLDLIIYLQHLVFHSVPFLWRLHRVHHVDPDIDVTTGVRFHPFEILVSMLIKIITILTLGPPVLAVVLFEVILNAASLFNHGNVRLPGKLDQAFRLLIVTPDMHRVHHSVENHETNSNFGFCLSFWDRLFGTYIAQPESGHINMQIGLREFSDPVRASSLASLLLLPFAGDSNANQPDPGHED